MPGCRLWQEVRAASQLEEALLLRSTERWHAVAVLLRCSASIDSSQHLTARCLDLSFARRCVPACSSPLCRVVHRPACLPACLPACHCTVSNPCPCLTLPAVCNSPCSVGYLRVEAEASTDSRPLAGFTPRRGEGLPFGIMGRSSSEPPARRGLRVDFQFDR